MQNLGGSFVFLLRFKKCTKHACMILLENTPRHAPGQYLDFGHTASANIPQSSTGAFFCRKSKTVPRICNCLANICQILFRHHAAPQVDEVYIIFGTPLGLRAALLRKTIVQIVTLYLGGITSEHGVPMPQGGRQGGTCIDTNLNTLANPVFEQLRIDNKDVGWGLVFCPAWTFMLT